MKILIAEIAAVSERKIDFPSENFTAFLQLLIAFISSKSPEELDRLRCATGFTAFTPNYPGAPEKLSTIFAMTPYSNFGLATLVLAVFLTKLALARSRIPHGNGG